MIVELLNASKTRPAAESDSFGPGGRNAHRLLAVATAFVVLIHTAGPMASAANRFVSGPHPAIVRVMAMETNGASFGSGSLVAVSESHGLVVTNWHVVRDATGPITVFFPDGFHSGATVLRVDRDWDLAALAIWRPRATPIGISNEAPRPGESLVIAGYGSGDFRAVSGRCTQYVSPGGDHPYEMIELDAGARNGDSGGPILNNRGELAGVLFGSAFGRTTGSYCGRLRSFLASVDGDFRQMPSAAMIAQQHQQPQPQQPLQQPQSTQTPNPVAAIPATQPETPAAAPAAVAQNASPGIGKGTQLLPAPTPNVVQPIPVVTAAPAASVAARPQGPLPSIEQIKSILAVIGVVAVLYTALKLLGSAVG